jgi:HAD superfamily phosphatase (TIGR01668 family)
MRFLKPEEYFATVLDIDASELASKGYRGVLLDFDNTIQPRGHDHVPADVAAWVESLKTAGLKVALVSNTNGQRVLRAAQDLQVCLVRNAFKPLTGGYVRACACLGIACDDALMIGDQSYTDILGAHRLDMDAFMVKPQNASDPIHTRALRILDALAVRDMQVRGDAQ